MGPLNRRRLLGRRRPRCSAYELQIRENKARIQEKTGKKLFAERNLGVLARELKYTELSLNKAKTDLDSSEKKEQQFRQKLNTVRRQYSDSSTQFSSRLRSIYQNQNLGFVEYLFTSRDLTSIVDSAYYFDRVLNRDSQLIQSLRQKYAEVKREKSQVERETRRISDLSLKLANGRMTSPKNRTDKSNISHHHSIPKFKKWSVKRRS